MSSNHYIKDIFDKKAEYVREQIPRINLIRSYLFGLGCR